VWPVEETRSGVAGDEVADRWRPTGGAQVAGAIERMEAGEVGCARELHAILSM
jgi:hypothetical protein